MRVLLPVNPEGAFVMEHCPECGRPVRISMRSGRRYWTCTGRYQSPSCSFEKAIPDDERLATELIAKASVQSRDNGDQLAKDQAKYRRNAGGLDKVVDESLYLSGPERDVLRQAAGILRRLGDAAEVAKRKKKQWEKAREAQATRRREEVHKALKARYLDAGLSVGDRYLVLSALARRNQSEPLFSRERLQRVFDHALVKREPFAKALERELDFDLRSAIDEEAQFVGYGHGDIAAALHDLFVDVDQRLSDLRETEDLMLTAIADKLAVADDPKIVPLRR